MSVFREEKLEKVMLNPFWTLYDFVSGIHDGSTWECINKGLQVHTPVIACLWLLALDLWGVGCSNARWHQDIPLWVLKGDAGEKGLNDASKGVLEACHGRQVHFWELFLTSCLSTVPT